MYGLIPVGPEKIVRPFRSRVGSGMRTRPSSSICTAVPSSARPTHVTVYVRSH